MISDYSFQTALINNAYKNLKKHRISLLAACPGAGKTNMAIAIMNEFLKEFPNKRVLILTHGQSVLRTQFAQRMKSLGIQAFEEVTANRKLFKKTILVTLPQTIMNSLADIKCDLLIIDEAHQFYGGQMIEEIKRKTSPQYELLLTGTPGKFIGEMPISFITLSELIKLGVLIGPTIHLNKAYLGEIDKKDINAEREINHKKIIGQNVTELLNQLIQGMDENVFKKTMIICSRQKQAMEIHSFLIKQGKKSYISTSDYCSSSQETFEKFKKDGNFLVVSNRGILGFDYPELTAIIDLSCTLNINRIFQQVCRIVRRGAAFKKHYFKVFPESLETEFKQVLMTVLSMAYPEGFLKKLEELQPIAAPRENIDRSGIFLGDEISFEKFQVILGTPELWDFSTPRNSATTYEQALKTMYQYDSYRTFKDEHKYAYKILISKCPQILRGHFPDHAPVKVKWDLQKAKEEAEKHNSRTELKSECPGAYKFLLAKDREWLDSLYGNQRVW